MKRRDPLSRRLAPLLGAYFFGALALWVPVEKLLLDEIGFTPRTIGLMAAAYAAVVPLLEVPSGILADRWSRRGVLAVANAGAFASVLVGGVSPNVPTYLAAALLLGVYFAMTSGTFEAVVYDTVLEVTGSSDRFESTIGRVRIAESVSLVTGALAGGVVASLASPRAAYFATLPFLVLSALFLLAFDEPRLHEVGERRPLREHVTVAVTTLGRDRSLLPVALLLVLTGLLTNAVFEFGPLWLVEAGASTGSYGPAWAGLMASLGLGGVVAGRVRFDRNGTTAVVGVLLVASAAALPIARHPALATAAQLVLALLAVALGIFLTRVLHDAVASEVRSGVASGVGALTWIAFLPFALGFGALSERAGVHVAGWLLVGIAASTALVLRSATLPRRAEPAEVVALQLVEQPAAA
jgi:predicted MFS family arabinose efflux permease